jgi:DNA-binding response OmpR family regulator
MVLVIHNRVKARLVLNDLRIFGFESGRKEGLTAYNKSVVYNSAARILVIEDDPAVARGLHDGLAADGYEVSLAYSGAHGIRAMLQDRPQLVILDVRLPDGSGFDFCRQMRQQGFHQPILILTVQDDDVDKVLGLELGADDYMTKPYNPKELTARVRALLRRAYGEFSMAESKLLFVRDLTIDLMRATVSRSGSELNLTPTEYRLFVHLAKHPGQVFNRSQLTDAIWGASTDGDIDPQAITVYIRRLREKLELDPDHPTMILTVPGLGYRLAG